MPSRAADSKPGTARFALGTTSFAFRYALLDPATAPSFDAMVQRTADYGLSLLQVCENARPLDLPVAEWSALARRAAGLGVALRLGCKTTSADVLRACLDRAAAVGSTTVRVALENDDGTLPTELDIRRFLDSVVPLLAASGSLLLVENYFALDSRLLAEWCAPYPATCVGFCLDSANSLRRFESLDLVLHYLTPRARCWHIKDWRVLATNVGFRVEGVPMGQGVLPLDNLLRHIAAHDPAAEIYLENWVPPTGDPATDIAEDDRFNRVGAATLKQAIARLHAA